MRAYLHPKRESDSSPDNSNFAAGSLWCLGSFIVSSLINLLGCNQATVENTVQGSPVCCPFKVVFRKTFKKAKPISTQGVVAVRT